MNEINVRKCKICLKEKQRILVGKYNYKDKKYVDENGKEWMGNTCPECNRIRVKNTMRKIRNEKNK